MKISRLPLALWLASWLAVSLLLVPIVVGQDAPALLDATSAAKQMQLPRGFQATMFAAEPDVKQPIGFCVDDRARLWVAEAYNYPKHGDRPGDRIVILEDTDGDGTMDRRKVFFDKLNYVTGIEVGFGGVWVVSPPYFYFLPDKDQDDVPDGPPVVLLDGLGNHANSHNLANGLAWGPDGWLYGTHGRTNWSLLGKPGAAKEDRVRFDGGVYRYHPTRHIWEPFCDGTTNPWGIDWNDVGQAFICNCVNPHLFHAIPGAHFEPWRGRKSSEFAFERIPTIADHLHFTGTGNVRDGIGSASEDAAGGGHAHCGMMIYLGENWPARYRNSLFTNNIHGRRINNDVLKTSGSTYVASHGADLMRAADPWFVGVTLAQGPAGEVYVSDWSDIGECHYVRNTQKETGRIFRIAYGPLKRPTIRIQQSSSLELAKLHGSRNEWMVRHARRLLQERAAAGESMEQVAAQLHALLASQQSTPARLHAMWTLHAIEQLDRKRLLDLSADAASPVRGWAVRLLGESKQLSTKESSRLITMATHESSASVRVEIASLLQRLTPGRAWPIAEALVCEPAAEGSDMTLAYMCWYGVEPLVLDDAPRFAKLARRAKIAVVREFAARRLFSLPRERLDEAAKLAIQAIVDSPNGVVAEDLMRGILQATEGRRKVAMPAAWGAAYKKWSGADEAQVSLHESLIRLALLFGDQTVIPDLKAIATGKEFPAARRKSAIQSLVQYDVPKLTDFLISLLDDPVAQQAAIQGLAASEDARVSRVLLEKYDSLSAAGKQDALLTLAARPTWAADMVGAFETGKIPPTDVTAYAVRQLNAVGSKSLTKRLQGLWGQIRETPSDRRRLIARYKQQLTSQTLAGADVRAGRELFKKHCATCHRMFGEGGKIGPDLSGAQRSNLDYLLENLLDPSASVAKAYQMETFRLESGRVITGIVETENDEQIRIYTINQRLVVDKEEVLGRKKSTESIMPEGVLKQLSNIETRDLIGYLRSAGPPKSADLPATDR